MPVSKGTKTNKTNIDLSILFPDSLIGKELIRVEPSNESINNEYELYLDNFLRFKDPQDFVNAVKCNNTLLGYFLLKNYRPKATLRESDTQVDSIRIVYETLSWWIQLHQWIGEKEEAKLAKKYIYKIAPILTLERKEVFETNVKDGLIHRNWKIKNTKPALEYISPEKFMERWNRVYEAFQKSKGAKRYVSFDRDRKAKDALKAISILGNELYDDEIVLLNLKDVRTSTASYIRVVHENLCPICNKKQLSDSTILNLLTKAKLELE